MNLEQLREEIQNICLETNMSIDKAMLDTIMQAVQKYVAGVIGDKHKLFGHGEDWEGSEPQNDLIDEQRKRVGLV